MQFRIVGNHLHRAVLEGSEYSCVRESTATDAGLVIRWSAWKDSVVLKNDCRTLNEAKNLCRSAAVPVTSG